MMYGCVVGRRMSEASLLYRPLLGVVDQRRDDPMFKPLTEFLSDGDIQRLLSPVRGLHGPRMIALLANQRLATEPVYDLVPLEAKGVGCAEPAGQACTPNNDPSISVVGVRLRRWLPAAANPNAGGE